MKYEPKIQKELCPIDYGLGIFGGRWKPRIVCVLSTKDRMRYSEIRKSLGNITDAVLAGMLRELTADDVISRTQYNEIPPRVEYALTDIGRSVLPILQSICEWSAQHTADHPDRKVPPCRPCAHYEDYE
jgi:DNA-binding HxlR family transcriptional regulator